MTTTVPLDRPSLCPECGSPMQIVTDGFVDEEYHPGYHVAGRPLPRRQRPTVFGACTGCELCIEIHVITARES